MEERFPIRVTTAAVTQRRGRSRRLPMGGYLSCRSNWPAGGGPWLAESLYDGQVERVGHLLTATRLDAQVLEYVNFSFDTDLKRKRKIKLFPLVVPPGHQLLSHWTPAAAFVYIPRVFSPSAAETMQVVAHSLISALYETMMQCMIDISPGVTGLPAEQIVCFYAIPITMGACMRWWKLVSIFTSIFLISIYVLIGSLIIILVMCYMSTSPPCFWYQDTEHREWNGDL